MSQTYQMLRRYSDTAGALDRAVAVSPEDATSRVARALVDLESDADTQPGHDLIHKLVKEDPSAVDALAELWFYLGVCRRDSADIARALASLASDGIIPVAVRMPRNFCEGIAARAQGNLAAAEAAFNSARSEMQKLVDEQPDFAEALSVLGMSNAALGRKEEALSAGRRAAELFPLSKDAVTGGEILRNLAITHAWAGEKDLAIQELEGLIQIPSPISYGQLRLHPWWDPLRDDPRFEKLVAEARNPVTLK